MAMVHLQQQQQKLKDDYSSEKQDSFTPRDDRVDLPVGAGYPSRIDG